MSTSKFNHIKITGFNTVVPKKSINIDDEIEFFDNSEKKLNRAKKMVGYGVRHIVDENTTVLDLCVDAAQKLFADLNYNYHEIDLLIFVNQKPDYREPVDACIAHGLLNLSKNCATLSINFGCSGYVYGLWTAMGMLSSGAAKKCLLLAGDLASFGVQQNNRKLAGLFGDAGSATIIEFDENFNSFSYFDVGTDGKGWDKIITPFGGTRLPFTEETVKIKAVDKAGNVWNSSQGIIQGEDVFKFSIEAGPLSIKNVLEISHKTIEEIDFFSIHQANKQIVDTIAYKAGIPENKYSSETFSKYGNTSTVSVATVLCDVLYKKQVKEVILCSFGIGLSWATCLVNLSEAYNGGIIFYEPQNKLTKEEQTQHWINHFKGEDDDN